MPKHEHPKSGQHRNPNQCRFGFRHVPITTAQALMNKPNLSEIKTFRNQPFELKLRNFGPNCPKSEQYVQNLN